MSRSDGDNMLTDPWDTYLLIRTPHVPERWRARATQVSLVALLPHEAEQLLEGTEAPTKEEPNHELLHLVAQGKSASQIAGALGVSLRTVQNRLAELRKRFEVETSAELAALLARRGF